ncbi:MULTISPECIES: phage tail tube protein [unclassified Granulicatella]|uniref:phage tail tube protein n=1 Tax=unclassified Granulicatella TaxID=2630493 RepID=UPI0010737209|nr:MULTISPECIES: phage tail tube protein [unclassified Granulicatella]MBF0779795.1 phage tail protein [Granulicatella sp. 19428wC4_WM01]TFU96197.1 phage tail protein [Granulicatella sp. WM01]
MLANGITLHFGETKDAITTLLSGLKEVPEFGVEPEKVENTTLADKVKKYENGIGDAGDLEYKFKHTNDSEHATFRIIRKAQESQKTLWFKQTYPDGTTVTFSGAPSVKVGGGGVNAVIESTVKIALNSEFIWADPASL